MPSEKDATNKGFLNKDLPMKYNKIITKTAKEIDAIKNMNHRRETDAEIPIVMAAKYVDSSRGDLTGFRKRTIDNAPTIPRERAIFPEITFVMTNVIIGNTTNVAVWAFVLIHACPKACNRKRKYRPPKINIEIDVILSEFSDKIFIIVNIRLGKTSEDFRFFAFTSKNGQKMVKK